MTRWHCITVRDTHLITDVARATARTLVVGRGSAGPGRRRRASRLGLRYPIPAGNDTTPRARVRRLTALEKSSGDGADRDDPLDGLVGHRCDEIEVVVVVQNDEPCGFGRGGDE